MTAIFKITFVSLNQILGNFKTLGSIARIVADVSGFSELLTHLKKEDL